MAEFAIVLQGHKQWLFDHTGKRYLDLFAGIVTVSVGHCHPLVTKTGPPNFLMLSQLLYLSLGLCCSKVLATAKEQLSRLWHTTNIYLHPQIHEFAEKLVSKLPGNLKVHEGMLPI